MAREEVELVGLEIMGKVWLGRRSVEGAESTRPARGGEGVSEAKAGHFAARRAALAAATARGTGAASQRRFKARGVKEEGVPGG